MTQQDANVRRARLLLLVLVIGWGLSWPMMAIALREIPPFTMRTMTLALAAATLAMLAGLQGHGLAVRNRRAWKHIVIASLFNIVFFSALTPFAQLHAATSRVAIVIYTMPIWASLLALVVLKERLDGPRALGLALCIAGLAVLIAPLASVAMPGGILIALGAAISWAIGTIYLKWARIDGNPTAVTFWQLVFAVCAIALGIPVVDGWHAPWTASAQALLAVAFSGIIGAGISYFLWFDIVRRLPAMTASLGVLASPVIGVVASAILLGERPTVADIVGFSMMLAASACVMLRPQPATKEGAAA